jgi:hypothetical protein
MLHRGSVFGKITESGSDQGAMLKKQSTSRNTKDYFPSPAASNTNGLLFVSSHRGKEAIAVEIAERKEKVSNEGRTQHTRLLCITSAK